METHASGLPICRTHSSTVDQSWVARAQTRTGVKNECELAARRVKKRSGRSDEEGLGGQLPPIRQQEIVKETGDHDGLLGSGEGRPEAQIM